MAVSRANIDDAIITGSEEICDFYCQPCSTDKKSLPAEGYCVDCKEYLCGTCFRYHRKLSATSRHALLDKKKMPRDKQSTRSNSKDMCTDQCPDHTEKTTEYHCKTHDQLGCSTCMTLNHRSCKGVRYIPNISDGIGKTRSFVQLNEKLNDLEMIVDENERKVRENCTAVEAISNESQAKIRECINEIKELFDTLQKAMSQNVEAIRDEDMSAMELISDQCDSVKSDIRSISSDLESKQKANQNSQLFVAMKNGEKEVKVVEDKMKQIITNNTIRQYTFVPERQISDLKRKFKQLGHLSMCQETSVDSGSPKIHHEELKSLGTDDDENCVICMDHFTDPKKLDCGHMFCSECIDQQFKYKTVCPTCGKVYGIITGDQPDGSMQTYTNAHDSCEGYRNCGRIEIVYTFKNGQQGPNHPAPGKWYRGIERKAYLPDNYEGRQICKMLKIAFDRKLVFTIGSSRVTGQEGVITWNDIHHKTNPKPYSEFGYPDNTYLTSVKDELAAKGVTEDDIK